MFPLSDSIRTGKIPFLTASFIVINVAVFIYTLTTSDPDLFISQFALIPQNVDLGNPATLIPFVTSIFLHGGFLHIISNVWFLWVFGDNVEAHLGEIKYLVIFLLSGIAGGLTQYFLNPESTLPMLGASGAVSGVLASYVTQFPTSKIKTFVIFFFFVTITSIPAVFFIFYWFFIQLLSGLVSLPLLSSDQGGVAFWAHVGGFVTGIFLTRYLKPKRLSLKPNVIEGEIIE